VRPRECPRSTVGAWRCAMIFCSMIFQRGSRAVAAHLRDNSAIAGYCSGFAGVPGLTPECFFACAISSRTLSLPS
jgi:hypothetical protein